VRRFAPWVVLGIAAYGVFLVALLPARFVVARLALPPGLSLQNIDGTVWSGRATASWSSGGATLVLDGVRWRWRPLAVMSARLAYDVEARGNGLEAHLRVARGITSSSVEDLELRADASAVATAIPLASAWQPAGRVEVTSSSLAWNGHELLGRAQARWSDAALAISPVRPLGTYVLRLDGAGGPVRVTLATTEGALRLSGDGTLEGLQHAAFTGEARADGPQASALTPVLDLFGPRRPDGSRALRFP
jgi:general secretion pathway protein N